MRVSRWLIGLALVGMVGCATASGGSSSANSSGGSSSANSLKPVPIPSGQLVNEDLTIRAADDSFVLEGGERFETPFAWHNWGGRCPGFDHGVEGIEDEKLLGLYGAALECGAARPVVIEIEGRSDPIYGALHFNNAVPSATGPATNSYYVKIPEERIDFVLEGNTAVAVERMSWRAKDSGGDTHELKWYSWILWLSPVPLS